MFRNDRKRPFAASDSKRISNDYGMLYPGLLDRRTGDEEAPTRVRSPLRTIVNGLTNDRASSSSPDPYSKALPPTPAHADPTIDAPSWPFPERISSRNKREASIHVKASSSSSSSSGPDYHIPITSHRPRPTPNRSASSAERVAKWERSGGHNPSTQKLRSRSRPARTARRQDLWVVRNMNPEATGYCEEDFERQRQEEVMRDLDEWFDSAPAPGSITSLRSDQR